MATPDARGRVLHKATLPDGTVVKRRTGRDYRFVVVAQGYLGDPKYDDGKWGVWQWSGRRDLAEKAAQTARKVYRDVRVVPAEVAQ